ncbi:MULTISPECIES: PLP-dependent cysteine synthase family protein [Brevibacillus]|uniref:O-acetylserine (thiol)-lyase n=1 Tax=Brevibacillus brevis (strain 47 / JCM 6285 / NBRC 100599) TaxID=358681 RepID=C0ZKT6_BREBN|nr:MULTISPECIES: cysteine synthase family protein [Brevibacillus]MBH0328624.1 cysteine synthase [Brevibacillus brevis]NQF15015.1 cysteine synthase family protein [Brevibacillus sp. HB1.3]NRR04140.1 cysteine synthase family protein [Brevibacillus sp. RS1.1]NRS48171.1 cysteine synthase family protein [Brevibacillus sp. HB2.2]BAH45763.1 cysteine synthase/cystathionine beta-synthase [Brevibacillus brevis NBRC 100599]
MNVFRNVKELIGNTPIVEITQFELPEGVRLFAKLEYFNPGGSVKDRLGIELIRAAEENGQLAPGGTIIEPTAGNTGIGVALAAVGTGYKVIFCVPAKFSEEKQELMRALGAEVVNTPTELGIKGAIAKAKELAESIPGAFVPQQFANPANPDAHYKTTGPEIWSQMDGQVNVFVAGAGSGGTFMGAARYLKEQNPNVKTVIVEPEGSILNGGESGPHKTEGIGMEFLPPFMDTSYFNAIHTILDVEAFDLVKQLAAKEGLLVGSSSGAAMAAALREAREAAPGTNIVTLFADGSERYLSKKIYQGGI